MVVASGEGNRGAGAGGKLTFDKKIFVNTCMYYLFKRCLNNEGLRPLKKHSFLDLG